MSKLLSAVMVVDGVQLLDGSDRIARQLVNQYRWYILPLANPDGYVFTWTTVTTYTGQYTLRRKIAES